MGFFTYRRVGKVRKEVAGLRKDAQAQAHMAQAERTGQALREAIEKLPPEGKREIKALRDAFHAKNAFVQGWTMSKFGRRQRAIIRKYQDADPLADVLKTDD
jgi:hypothetical protein